MIAKHVYIISLPYPDAVIYFEEAFLEMPSYVPDLHHFSDSYL
jgi:hypothetical protein